MTPAKKLDRFKHSRRLVWTMCWSAILLTVAVIVRPSPEAAQVVTVVAPTLLGLAAAWSGITNWAEVSRPSLETATPGAPVAGADTPL